MPEEDSSYYTKNEHYLNSCIGTLFNKQEGNINNTDRNFESKYFCCVFCLQKVNILVVMMDTFC